MLKRESRVLDGFSSKIAINKGWSYDKKKYCVTDQNQQKIFLACSDKEKLDS